ncbi:MAG: tellurite resistance TerB family protein [Enterovibrio sp.]
MSIFKQAQNAFAAGREELANQVSRFKNKKFMEATVSICAYIAMASDGVDAEEKKKMMAFIKNSDELKVFDSLEIINFFNKRVEVFEFDHDVGKGEAMKFIVQLKDDASAAQLAVRVGVAVGKSDGDFDAAEKNAVKEICIALGLEPSMYQ